MLDPYEAERLPVAEQLDTTDHAFRLVVSDSWIAGLLRTAVVSGWRRWRSAFRHDPELHLSHSVPSAGFTTAPVPFRNPSMGYREEASRRPFPSWLRLKLRDDGPVEDLFQEQDDTKLNLV